MTYYVEIVRREGARPVCRAAWIGVKHEGVTTVITAERGDGSLTRQGLEGRYQLEVIDLLEHPQLAVGDQILAIPMLVRKVPVPIRKIIGDLI